MRGGCSCTRRSRGTARERLLDAAEQILAERGYRGASVDEVAAAAGVTKGLYWNFARKHRLGRCAGRREDGISLTC